MAFPQFAGCVTSVFKPSIEEFSSIDIAQIRLDIYCVTDATRVEIWMDGVQGPGPFVWPRARGSWRFQSLN